jgi:hypothetical protein
MFAGFESRGHKNARADLTVECVKELLDYNPLTGIFKWKISLSNRVAVGSEAGTVNNDGYVSISIRGMRYYAHRLAWLYMTGQWPEYEIDHEDTNKANNIWKNLRPATPPQNSYNRPLQSNNTSGYKGVCRWKDKWVAYIKGEHIGVFDTPEEGAQAYNKAADRLAGLYASKNTMKIGE